MRPHCTFLGCKSPAIWTDVDDDRVYCGAHAVLEIDAKDEDLAMEKRRLFAEEYARDAAREGYER